MKLNLFVDIAYVEKQIKQRLRFKIAFSFIYTYMFLYFTSKRRGRLNKKKNEGEELFVTATTVPPPN